jgi:hypothetical protein
MTVLVFADLRSTANTYRKVLKRTHQLDQANAMSISSEEGSANINKSTSPNRYLSSPNATINKKSLSISHSEDTPLHQPISATITMKPGHHTMNGVGSSSNTLLHPTPSSSLLNHTPAETTSSIGPTASIAQDTEQNKHPHTHQNYHSQQNSSSNASFDVPLFTAFPKLPSVEDSERPHTKAAIVPINEEVMME